MEQYKKYLAAKRARIDAESWHELPQTKRGYRGDTFRISPSHGGVKLVRCGQERAGGRNYWESPPELNAAILAVIARDSTVIEEAIADLRAIERKALVACRAEAEKLMADVIAAEQ